MSQNVLVSRLIDDLWITVFQFCTIGDVIHITESCKQLNQTVENTKNTHRMNTYWELQCKRLCDNINPLYTTKNWHALYFDLRYLLYSHGYIETIDSRTHKITKPLPPFTLTTDRTQMKANKDNLISVGQWGQMVGFSQSPRSRRCMYDHLPILFQAVVHDCVYVLQMELTLLENKLREKKTQKEKENEKAKAKEKVKIQEAEKEKRDEDGYDSDSGTDSMSDSSSDSDSNLGCFYDENNSDDEAINCRFQGGINFSVGSYFPLIIASSHNSIKVVKYLLSLPNINIGKKDYKKGKTSLMCAAESIHDSNSAKIVGLLLNHKNMTKSIINATDKLGQTAIYLASLKNHKDAVSLLLKHGADVNIRDKKDCTLIWAAMRKYPHGGEALKVLVESNSVTNIIDSPQGERDGISVKETPLFHAVQRGWEIFVQLLLESKKVDVNWCHPKSGESSLWIAAKGISVQLVKMLIAHKANINQTDADGATPLFVACENGRLEIVKELVAHGADINLARHVDKLTPLMIASEYGNIGTVKHLLTCKNINVIAVNDNNQNALSIAAMRGRSDVVKILGQFMLEQCNNNPNVTKMVEFVNNRDKHYNWTPLMFACTVKPFVFERNDKLNPALEMVKYLIQVCNAQVNIDKIKEYANGRKNAVHTDVLDWLQNNFIKE